jgi:NAD(P)-dependent dehydrogenase (short-subunit alcohol dehydrogenase family)
MQSPGDKAKTALQGKVAVITGAGSGVGKAMANAFAKNGSAVVLVDVISNRVEEVVNQLKDVGPGVKGLTIDLSQASGPVRMIDEAEKVFGHVDILCNNAGIMDSVMPVAETSDEAWDRVMDINLNAVFRASRRVIPSMLKTGGGSIVNTSSVAGLFGGVAGAAYTTSKHALMGLTKSIASYYGPLGIRCNAMVLGGVNTNIGMGSSAPDQRGVEHLMKVSGLIPRMAEPSEIAELALFLVSDRSSYINGSCIVIDGGWTVL